METKPEIQAAERIVEECLKGEVITNADILMARKLGTEDFLKAMISVISNKHADFHTDPEKKAKVFAVADINQEKVDCAFRDIPLPTEVQERRAVHAHIKSLKYKPL